MHKLLIGISRINRPKLLVSTTKLNKKSSHLKFSRKRKLKQNRTASEGQLKFTLNGHCDPTQTKPVGL